MTVVPTPIRIQNPRGEKRKSEYLIKLKGSPEEIILVSLADKIHNARSILSDLKITEGDVWGKFNGGKKGTLWYYQSLVEIFQNSTFTELTQELKGLVDEITALAQTREETERWEKI